MVGAVECWNDGILECWAWEGAGRRRPAGPEDSTPIINSKQSVINSKGASAVENMERPALGLMVDKGHRPGGSSPPMVAGYYLAIAEPQMNFHS